jgi:hypothetical protein
MRSGWTIARSHFDVDALERSVEHARLALACPFSSSAEYEAALIQERRAAGVYGPRRHRRPLMAVGLAVAALVVLIIVL